MDILITAVQEQEVTKYKFYMPKVGLVTIASSNLDEWISDMECQGHTIILSEHAQDALAGRL